MNVRIEVLGGPVGEIERGEGDSPKITDPVRTHAISPAHANNWRWGWR
jgi:hypothetical protein